MSRTSLPHHTFLLALLGILILFSVYPVQAATLPSNFTEQVFASGLSAPTAMEFAPDGRLFVAQQSGALRVIQNGSLLPNPFVTLNVNSTGERGLLGIAFDPNFANNQFIYLYYTTGTAPIHNRVSRFTANGTPSVPGNTVVANSELILMELEDLSATNYNGGAIHFGPDGKLYVAVGENAIASNAQVITNRLGKILRINSNGTIPTDNPFFNSAAGANRSIWALGLRNPFTFAFQPGTGRMFINDVGAVSWEEINDGIVGSNYGWPTVEGDVVNPNFRTPLFAYPHGSGGQAGCAIAGGAFYNPPSSQFPADYLGDYFFADLCNRWIRRYDPVTDTVFDFASTTDPAPVDIKIGSDGSLYYLVRGSGGSTGAIYRVRYSSPAGDTLALYNTTTGAASLINSLQDLPPAGAYNTYTLNSPVVGSGWVMGDWNGDGQKTPGIFLGGAFRYTNGIGPSTSWFAVWIGAFPGLGPLSPVAGRFDPAIDHDCFGVAHAASTTDPRQVLHYHCDLSVTNPPGGLRGQWIGNVLPGPDPYQFVVGDWDNDGLDSLAARRGLLVTFGNVAPANGPGVFPLAQHLGAPEAGSSQVVAGDWDNNGIDTFGLYYPATGNFYRRSNLEWNTGVYILQRVGLPVGNAALVASWRSFGQTSFDIPFASMAALAEATLEAESTETVEATTEATPETTTVVEATEAISPEVTETIEATEAVETTETVAETSTPFPTLPLPGASEPTVTPSPFPTLPPIAPPEGSLPTATLTPTLTLVPLSLPAVASMDDGAPGWQASAGWALTAQAAFSGQGLGWQVIATNTVETLRWTPALDLRAVPRGYRIEFAYQSLLSTSQSAAAVQISLDGLNWIPLAATVASEQWVTETLDLSAYVGQVVYIQFVFSGVAPTQADQSIDYWLIDQVQVQAFAPELTALPTGLPTASETVLPSATLPPTATETPAEIPTTPPTATDAPTTAPVIPETEQAPA